MPENANMHRNTRIAIGSAALALGLIAGGTGIAYLALDSHSSPQSSASSLPSQRFTPGSGFSARGATDTTASVAATAAQKIGVVTIVSTIDYDSSSQAAGTGTILTSSGYILTNNHVIEGATSIEVTVESTGKTYTATVVGTDVTDDIAVLKLANASGLTTASYSTAAAATGDAVTAIGNAEGTGNLVAATGTVTATNQSITVQGDTVDQSENLTDLIETNADVVSGDSGGPLVNSSGKVVGMDTAASAGTRAITGYAIPIAKALSIARQIESPSLSGQISASGNVTIGYPAFLGVEFSRSASGLLVGAVVSGTPAESAGIVAGDTITALNGETVTSESDLSSLITAHKPGDGVTVSWTDATGASHTATATLASGPAA